jgi:peptidoglycan/xylan/chitin deacetylase (PgdA/CDA1 family)
MHSDVSIKDPGEGAGARVPFSHLSFRQKSKRLLAGGLFHSRLLRLLRRLEGSHILRFVPGSYVPQFRNFMGSKFGILCYHRVGIEGMPYHSRLEPRIFEAQMNYLKKHYRLVPLSRMCRELEDGCVVPPTIAITFDDGYRDLYTHAFPVLRRLQIPATIYLIGECMHSGTPPWYDRIFSAVHHAPGPSLEVKLDTARTFKIDSPADRSSTAWELVCYLRSLDDTDRREWCINFERFNSVCEDELQSCMLDWPQIREMSQAGISFGAHTWTHPSVSRLSSEALDRELGETKAFLEAALSAEVADFAYPFGKPEDCSSLAERALSKFQYRSAVTTSEGINSSGTNVLKLRRLQIAEDKSLPLFALAIAQMFFESVEDASVQTRDGVEVREHMTKSVRGLS